MIDATDRLNSWIRRAKTTLAQLLRNVGLILFVTAPSAFLALWPDIRWGTDDYAQHIFALLPDTVLFVTAGILCACVLDRDNLKGYLYAVPVLMFTETGLRILFNNSAANNPDRFIWVVIDCSTYLAFTGAALLIVRAFDNRAVWSWLAALAVLSLFFLLFAMAMTYSLDLGSPIEK